MPAAVDNLNRDTTFAQARQQLTSAGEEFTSAWDRFTSKVDC